MINPPELSINDEARNEAHIASTSVRLLAKKTKRGSSDASPNQLNQAR